jgi:hypothetical protein
MQHLSDKETGDKLTAKEWSTRSLEVENLVTKVGNELNEDDTEQLYKSLFKLSRQPLFLEYIEDDNKYIIKNDKVIDIVTDLKDGFTAFVAVNKTNEDDKPKIEINGNDYSVLDLNGNDLPKNSFKPKELIPLVFKDDTIYLGINNSAISKDYVLWYTNYSDYVEFTEHNGKIIEYVLMQMRAFKRGDYMDIHLVFYADIEEGTHYPQVGTFKVNLMEFLKDYLDCYNKDTNEVWKIVEYNYCVGRYAGVVNNDKWVEVPIHSTLWKYDSPSSNKNVCIIESYENKDFSQVSTIKYHIQFNNVKVK